LELDVSPESRVVFGMHLHRKLNTRGGVPQMNRHSNRVGARRVDGDLVADRRTRRQCAGDCRDDESKGGDWHVLSMLVAMTVAFTNETAAGPRLFTRPVDFRRFGC